MTVNQQKVLDKLVSAKRGITGLDFPQRFSYSSRISELRKKGYDILTIKEPHFGVMVARYFLKAMPVTY